MSNFVLENDMAAARAEARGQFGAHANAEELIRAHAASISPEVRAAQRKAVDPDATASLDWGQIKVPEGGKVVDAVVRGNSISFVWEDERRQWHKGAQAYNDAYEAPVQTVGDAVAQKGTEQAVEERDAIVDLRVEMEEQIAKVRAEFEQKAADDLAKLREEHQSEIEKLQADLQKQAEKGAEKPGGSGSGGAKSGSAAKKPSARGQAQANKRHAAEN